MSALAKHFGRFAGALREEGIRVSLSEEIDGATALTLLDMLDRSEVLRGLRIAMRIPREAWSVFDRLFAEHWAGEHTRSVPPPPPADSRRAGALQWRWDGTRVRLDLPPAERSGEGAPGYSPEALLRRKPLDRITKAEAAAVERQVAQLAARFAARRSRRFVPTAGRGLIDLRRSFRAALATEGEFLALARKTRKLDEPRIVLLYDTSGSMDPYTPFHLAFAFALQSIVRRTEIYAFNTSLTRVTGALSQARISGSLERLAADVPDWSGGTRIGVCLAEFEARYGERVSRDTTVVIVSDGLDLGDPRLLAKAMGALKRRARMIIWLNPLAGDSRYEPTAAGMRAALPYVDRLAPGHDLASLERLTRLLN